MPGAVLKNPVEMADLIGSLEDEIVTEKNNIKEMTADDTALHHEMAREKAAGESTDKWAGLENHLHNQLWQEGNTLQELRTKKHVFEQETDAEFDEFAESQLERELENGRD